MIVYDLECRTGQHRFEGWFGSSEDFDRQQERGLVTCPQCGSVDVGKAIQAPRLSRKGNQLPAPTQGPAPAQMQPMTSMAAGSVAPALEAVMRKLAQVQADALKSSRYVGDNFAEDARAMHYGERQQEAIHGQATLEEARDLIDEGIAVAPLVIPVVPPDKTN